MKRILSLILIVLFVFSLCSCGNNKSEETTATEETKVKIEYPSPTEKTWERTNNNIGARYIFTLKEFTEKLNKVLKEMNSEEKVEFDVSNWKKLSEGLTDDNGVLYDSYYYETDTIAYTCAVEKDSKKVMNIGCGCSFEMFTDTEKDYQYSVLVMSSLIACVAGGYSIDNLEFMYNLFLDVTNNETAIYFKNGVYLVNYDNKEDSSVLFMISCADDSIKTKWNLVDYENYQSTINK